MSPKKDQDGCVFVHQGKYWGFRWRENVQDGSGVRRKLRFRLLGTITSDERAKKDRKTGKLKIPAHIQAEANRIIAELHEHEKHQEVSDSIGALVEGHYFIDVAASKKLSTVRGYRALWKLYLKERIGNKIMREFRRVDAFKLWKEIHADNQHLTHTTMSHVRAFLSGVFAWAKNTGAYTHPENPATADLPAGLPVGKETQAYSLEEFVNLMSRFAATPDALAVLALGYGGGMRKGEIAGLDWKHYERTETGAVIHVCRSVWRGKIIAPKNITSAADVHLHDAFVDYIEAWRQQCGNPTEGLMFSYSASRPINLESFARWTIKPVLDRCAVCQKHKGIHAKQDHDFQRDSNSPEWKGYHALRRGNATLLAKLKDSESAALMLRHASTGVTEQRYIKNTAQERRAAEAGKDQAVERKRQEAAGAIGSAFKRSVQ